MRVIDALEQHKSLLGASRALGVSQSSLSRTLHEVEDIVGGAVFERHARGVRANATGAILTTAARALLSTIRTLEADLERLSDGQKRTIRVGALPVAAHGLLPVVLARTNSRAARLSIEVIEGQTGQLIPALLSGAIDVIVGRLYAPAESDGLTRHVLYNEPISLVVRGDHPLLDRAAITVEDVQRHTLVLPAVTTLIERDVRAILQRIGLRVETAIQSSSVGFMRELLLSGDFVGAVPRVLVAGDLARDALRILPLALPPSDRPAGIIHRGTLGPAGQLLLIELEAEIARLAENAIVEPVRGE
nr:LysR substrate-binding domain-containing protein [Sphingomonas sp. CROZ-RG-20F-R02-07]